MATTRNCLIHNSEGIRRSLRNLTMRYPNTIDKNIYLAYIRKENLSKKLEQKIDSVNLNWDLKYPESLVELCIKTIAENWATYPIFRSIIVCENRCLLADTLDVELPLTELCSHVKDDAFWKRMFRSKWPTLINNTTNGKAWVEIFIEKFLAESLENLKPSEYNVEKIKTLIELCSPFVNCLRIDHLEASTDNNDSTGDHVPFDVILENLNELKSLSVTYDCKTIGTQFYLGCTTITDNDITKFTRGLAHTDLQEFEFHSSKLDPPMLKSIARSLDKTRSLRRISMANCRFGDAGLMAFLKVMTNDSLPSLKHICLRNNFISSEGAITLTNILRHRKIETMDLKLNPILAEGAIHILSISSAVGLVSLNLSSCSFDDSITETLVQVIRLNRTLHELNLSINRLGNDLGLEILKAAQFNPIIKTLDLRNTDIDLKTKSAIDAKILDNRDKNNTIHQ